MSWWDLFWDVLACRRCLFWCAAVKLSLSVPTSLFRFLCAKFGGGLLLSDRGQCSHSVVVMGMLVVGLLFVGVASVPAHVAATVAFLFFFFYFFFLCLFLCFGSEIVGGIRCGLFCGDLFRKLKRVWFYKPKRDVGN